MTSPILNPTYTHIHEACEQFFESSKRYGYNPDAVIGVSRGGLIPGVIFSHLFGVPLIPVSYSSKAGNGDDVNHENQLPIVNHQRLFVVDDIHDTGHTLSEIRDHYTSQGKEVTTWAMHYKEREGKVEVVDGYWCSVPEDAGWVIYPYETGCK